MCTVLRARSEAGLRLIASKGFTSRAFEAESTGKESPFFMPAAGTG
jgi:hypothetical protein